VRGYQNYSIKSNKYYILSTEIFVKRRYSLINKEFNTKAEAKKILETILYDRRFYNEVLKGSEAIRFGFKLNTKGSIYKKRYYKNLVKYIYPKDVEEMSMQEKKTFRTNQRRVWRRKHKNKGNRR